MKTTQCRLCQADIPHDYDHSIELSSEKPDSQDLDSVHFDPIHQSRVQPRQKEQWPDSAATAGVLFFLFISNASLFIVWLIFWGLYTKGLEVQDSPEPAAWKVTAVYLIAGVTCFLNGVMAYIAIRQLGSRLVCFGSVVFGLFWCGILIHGKTRG